MSTAIITGASSGIGEAASKRLLQDGWNVILISRSTDKMQKIVKGYDKYKIIPCDLSKPDHILSEVMPAIKSYLKSNSLSGIDLLLNNAGGIRPERVSKENLLSSFKWHIDLMLTTPYLLAQYLSLDDMYNMHASIINVGSLSAYYGARSPYSYQIAKSGLQGLTKCLAFELSRKNGKKVRCNNLELGM